MTEKELAAIEARYKALPEDVWTADNLFAYWQVHAVNYNMLFVPKTIYGDNNCQAEAEFVVHARIDIPALVSRVRDLEWELHRLKSRIVDKDLELYT